MKCHTPSTLSILLPTLADQAVLYILLHIFYSTVILFLSVILHCNVYKQYTVYIQKSNGKEREEWRRDTFVVMFVRKMEVVGRRRSRSSFDLRKRGKMTYTSIVLDYEWNSGKLTHTNHSYLSTYISRQFFIIVSSNFNQISNLFPFLKSFSQFLFILTKLLLQLIQFYQ